MTIIIILESLAIEIVSQKRMTITRDSNNNVIVCPMTTIAPPLAVGDVMAFITGVACTEIAIVVAFTGVACTEFGTVETSFIAMLVTWPELVVMVVIGDKVTVGINKELVVNTVVCTEVFTMLVVVVCMLVSMLVSAGTVMSDSKLLD